MNVIYETHKYLPVYKESDLIDIDLSTFFSTHKNSYIFVEDETGIVKGYIDHRNYKKTHGNCKVYPQPLEVIVEKKELPYINLHQLFEANPTCQAIPVIHHGVMIGAFLRNYSEELTAYDQLINKIALNIVQYFKKEVRIFLLSRNIRNISFIGAEEDRTTLQKLLADSLSVLPKGDYPGILTIDTVHSKSYREKLQKNSTPIYSLEELMTLILIPIVKSYCTNKGVEIHIYEGPLLDKLKSPFVHGLMKDNTRKIDEALADERICEKFSVGNKKIYKYLRDVNDGPLRDNYVTTNGLHLMMGIENRGKKIYSGNSIHLYGACLTYGMCVPEEYTVSAKMKLRMAALGYEVINHGVKNGHSLLNDFIYILSTPLRQGDHIVVINAFSKDIQDCLKANFEVKELSETLNHYDNSPWYFLDNTFHINQVANEIIAQSICTTIESIEKTKTKQERKQMAIANVEARLKPNQEISDRFDKELILRGYKEYLLRHKLPHMGATVGSVLLTANPITKGHEHLIKYAKSHCDILYVFIVEEDLFFFSTAERIMLTHEVISDPHIMILSTGGLMTARFTFPEYFTKSVERHPISHEDIPDLHCEIFGKFVSPLLGITIRFVGEEMGDNVTCAYNQKLRTLLPRYGIEVVEIPRLKINEDKVISSSNVRTSIKNLDFRNLHELVSKPIERYIKAKWNVKN